MDDFEVRCGDLLYGQSSIYLVECFLGEGSFGKVARCLKTATQEKVAVKIIKNQPHHIENALQEMTILQRIQRLDKDRCAIVRWSGWFESGPHFCLEFELLHMSLRDFLNRREVLTLDDMFSVLYQLAAALALLELFGIIHADLKPDNIMLVDGLRPLKVKIIDFGLACHISQVQVGAIAGTRWYMAPEILLGLPYTGAIDVWALGCMAIEMFTGYPVYPGCSEYQMLKYISETQGSFPDHMLDVGINTKLFFNKGWFWTLKSTGQYCRETGVRDVENRWYRLNSLDDLAQADAGDEVQNFVDLVKGMLQLDAGQRITPKGIGKHPICISPCHGNAEHADTSQDGSSCLDMVTSLGPNSSLVSEGQILSSQSECNSSGSRDGSSCLDMVTSLDPNSSLVSEGQILSSQSECNSSGSRDVSSSTDMVTSLSPSSSPLFSSNSTEQSRLQQQESCAETSSSSSNTAAPEVTSDHSEALKPAADVHKARKRSKVKGFFVKLLKTLCCCCCPTSDDV